MTVNGQTWPITVTEGDTVTLGITTGDESGDFVIGYCPDASCSLGYPLTTVTASAGVTRSVPVTASKGGFPNAEAIYYYARHLTTGNDLTSSAATILPVVASPSPSAPDLTAWKRSGRCRGPVAMSRRTHTSRAPVPRLVRACRSAGQAGWHSLPPVGIRTRLPARAEIGLPS